MSIARLRSHFSNWREWELNPVVIKELRQAVRSLAVTGMLLLFLIVLFITSLVFLVNQSFVVTANEQLGGDIFHVFMSMLAGACILFVPLYVGVRMAGERQENNTDLLYISTLSPTRVIWGKFLCAAYMTLLFYSACMPFMAFTNLLRGVDFPTVFFILVFLFVVVCAVSQLAIFIACLPLSRPIKSLLTLGGLFLSCWLLAGIIFSGISMMRSGIGSMMAEPYFWLATVTVGGSVASVGGLFFILSVALISPPSANRALLPRIYVTISWLLSGVVVGCWAWSTKEPTFILLWAYVNTVLLVASLIVSVSNCDRLSVRVKRTIPARGLKRLLAFVFFNGAAGGLIWVGTLTALTYFGTFEYYSLFAASVSARGVVPMDDFSTFFEVFPPVAIYIFAYGLTALFIQRKYLPRQSPKLAGILTLLIAGLAAIGPSIVLFFLNRLSWKSIEAVQLGSVSNVFVMQGTESRTNHLLFACGWLVIVLVLNAKWFVTQAKSFHRPSASEPPTLN